MPSDAYDEEARHALMAVARRAIRAGLGDTARWSPEPSDYPPALRALRASFVTLHLEGRLRGCMGRLTASRPLVVDVAANAHAAANHDPRFAPVTPAEAPRLRLHVAVLSSPEPLPCASEDALLAALRVGIDGLTLSCGNHQATFLPAVWDSLPRPAEFLRELRRKAGLAGDFWSPDLRFERYTTEAFGDD